MKIYVGKTLLLAEDGKVISDSFLSFNQVVKLDFKDFNLKRLKGIEKQLEYYKNELTHAQAKRYAEVKKLIKSIEKIIGKAKT